MFQTISEIVEQVIKSVQNTGIFIGKLLQKQFDELKGVITTHKYQVEVQNPTEKVEVKGTVIVGNQTKVEKDIKDVVSKLQELKKAIPSMMKVQVTNQEKLLFPKSFEVTNFPDKTKVLHLEDVIDELEKLNEAIGKLKLNPEIKVASQKIPAPIVNVPKQPAPVVKITEKEVDLSALNNLTEFWQSLTTSAKKSLSVRLTDGTKFYKAIDEFIESTANVSMPFANLNGDSVRAIVDGNQNLITTVTDTWGTNNTIQVGDLTYLGKEDVDGRWSILRIYEPVENDKTLNYATVVNNPLITSYLDAWDSRAGLVYGIYSEAF